MTLTGNPTRRELESYRNWVRTEALTAKNTGLHQKAAYFLKRESWADAAIDSMKVFSKMSA